MIIKGVPGLGAHIITTKDVFLTADKVIAFLSITELRNAIIISFYLSDSFSGKLSGILPHKLFFDCIPGIHHASLNTTYTSSRICRSTL